MMSVFTKLLLLSTCLFMLADGAPNKKDDEKFQSLSHLRPQGIFPNPTKTTRYLSLTASSSSRAPLGNSFTTGSGSFLMPSGTANINSSSGSTGAVPYPTEGAPYQNSTSIYTKQVNREGVNGESVSGNQCPLEQTVTLPPQTITLPAQTVTMTPAPETVTITLQAQTETVTVDMTPQTQITTVTVWISVTADQAPNCPSPSNAASPQTPLVPAPNPQPSHPPVASLLNNAPTPVIVPPAATTTNLVARLSTGDVVPIASGTLPVIPNLGPTTATGPTTSPANGQTSQLFQQTSSSLVSPRITSTPIIAPYPFRNATNQTLPFGSGSSHGFRPTGFGSAKSAHRDVSSYFVYKFVTDTPISTTTIGPSPTREYLLGNGSSSLTSPSRANTTVLQSAPGPTAPPSSTREYFPDNGSSLLTPATLANATASPIEEYFPDDGSSLLTPPTLASATASPIEEYFPDDGSSLLTPQAQADATSVSQMGRPTAPIITSAVVGSSQTAVVVVGSFTPPVTQLDNATSILPVSTPIPPPSPPTIQPNTSIPQAASTSISQTPQSPTTNTPPFCTNGTTAQNITTNVRPFPPPAQSH